MGIIYAIVNKINDATYIGSSSGKGNSRWVRHRKDLRNNEHHSLYLQRAYNKYGEENFEFIVLKNNVDKEELLIEEQKYLDDRKNNYLSNLNYNICWIAGNCSGRKFSDSSIKKMSNSHLGKTVTLEIRKKISKTWGERANKTYSLISPNGEIKKFNNVREFCRNNNLENSAINLLLNGKIYYCKGWVKDYTHTYSFISPDGIIYENIVNLTEFCEKYDLKMKGMSKLHRGKAKSYFKWKKYNNNENK